ncbi:Rad2 nuclease [Kappamyces sp. JEL0680]|nr:Rad2 nuclease [Kappamyces sp. JEL0680]
MELAQDKSTEKFVAFCMKRVKLLEDNGIIPFLVFDGDRLPMKKATEQERRKQVKRRLNARRRATRKAQGLAFLEKGETAKAMECFQTSVNITPEMAYAFIKALKQAKVQYVVAPYEADAQLAYLDKVGKIDAVLTEDSDLLSFGCSRVIYKLGQDGKAIEIRASAIGNIKEMRCWTIERFRQMCILAGCDYLASPPGIGVKKAIKLLENCDAYTLIKSWKTWGHAVKAPKLAPQYFESFRLADLTFQHQRVYDAATESLVPLSAFPADFDLTDEISNAIGPAMEPHVAKGIAEGRLHPETKEPFPADLPLAPAAPNAGILLQRVDYTQQIYKYTKVERTNQNNYQSKKDKSLSRFIAPVSKTLTPSGQATKSKFAFKPVSIPQLLLPVAPKLHAAPKTTLFSQTIAAKENVPAAELSGADDKTVAEPTSMPKESRTDSQNSLGYLSMTGSDKSDKSNSFLAPTSLKDSRLSRTAIPTLKRRPFHEISQDQDDSGQQKARTGIASFFLAPTVSPFFSANRSAGPEKPWSSIQPNFRNRATSSLMGKARPLGLTKKKK